MKELLKKCLIVFVFIPLGLFAQSNLNGSITEEASGMGISGIDVVVKGTSNGTISDFNGNYTLSNVNDNDVIVYSYVGYKTQEITFSGQETIDVVMQEDASLLNEVLLIGYGSTTKQDATGAVEKLKAEDFNVGAIVSPDQLISGKIAGVRVTSGGGAPGEGAEIRIRGGSSLSANNSPLIVVDGIPLDQRGVQGVRNQLNSINPSEIEEFVVLKDASATAIYGSRASNGVILITTKKGKKSTPFKVEYGFQFSTDQIQNKVDVLSANQFRNLVLNDPNEDGSFLGNEYTDWQDQIYRTANGGIHDISATQGFEHFSYRVNFNSTSKQGVLKNDLYLKNALSLNLRGDLFDNHLKLALTSKGSIDNNTYANRGAIGAAIAFDPTQPVYSADSPFDGFFEYTNADGSVITLAPKNPLAQLEQDDNRAKSKRNITNLNIDYKFHFLPELSFISNVGFDYSELDGKQFISANSATQENGQFKNFYTGMNRNTNLDLILKYKSTFESIDTKYEITGGHSYQEYYIQSNQTVTEQGTLVTKPTVIDRNALESYFGRASFDFLNKYLISGSFRRDGSSRFNDNNRWGNFPALSVGWKMSNEDFLKDSNTFSNVKLRAGYGVTGNQEIGQNYGYLGIYTPGENSASIQFGDVFVNTLRPEEFDENLKWEETTQYNVGVDLGFFNDYLSLSFDGYYRETKDLLARIPTAAGSNLSDLITTNVGQTTSKGLELGINASLFAERDFNWNLSANATLQDVEITSLNLSNDSEFFIPQGGISGGVGNNIQLWKPGYDPSTFFVFRQVYDQAGNPIEGAYVDVNGDNQITEADRQAYKKATPDFYYGFSSNMSYKNLEFSFTFRGSAGNYVYNNVNSSTGFFGNMLNPPGDFYQNGSVNVLDSNFENAQYFSDYYIQRADFLKLDNISLAYTVPFEKLVFQVRVTGTNILTITNYDGLDPEISNGIDNNFYPRPKGFVLGFNFTY